VQDRLPAAITPAVWEIIRGNLARVTDAAVWAEVVAGDIPPPALAAEDADFLAQALAALSPSPWSADTWGQWTTALKALTGRKGAALFRPLRLALTGREHGPEMAALLPLIGEARSRARLAARA